MCKMSYRESLFVNSYLDYALHRLLWLRRLLALDATCRPKRLLEVGCGCGITTGLLARHFPDAVLTAIDCDTGQLGRATKRLRHTHVNLVRCDAAHLPFGTGTFDACVASFALHHIPEFRRALSEVHRVLAPGSPLYILEVPVSWEIKRLTRRGQASGPGVLFTVNSLRTAIREAGFEIVQTSGPIYQYVVCRPVANRNARSREHVAAR